DPGRRYYLAEPDCRAEPSHQPRYPRMGSPRRHQLGAPERPARHFQRALPAAPQGRPASGAAGRPGGSLTPGPGPGFSMLPRVLEPEVMDSAEEACDYDAMDHSQVNRAFVADFLAVWQGQGPILDVGTGTALIPLELCRRTDRAEVIGVDLAEHMLAVGRQNVSPAGLAKRLQLELRY